MKGRAFGVLAVFLVLLSVNLAVAQDQVIVNSRDWQDIYSGMIYSGLEGIDGSYPIEETRAQLLLRTLDKSKEEVLLVQSNRPVLGGFQGRLSGEGFDVSLLEYDDSINLELARRINSTGFIVMDERYPYNAISIAPYASLKNYYVMFANEDNIQEVVEIIEEEGAEELIVYGYVDRLVSDELEIFDPEVINEGSKFRNNLIIVEMFLEERQSSQFVLTDGSFIEPQFFRSSNPVVFIGRTNTPDSTLDFLRDSEIKHGILIGNELVDLASDLKDRADMQIMVKFAKGINQEQYTLDIIQLPSPDYNPVVSEVMYNTLENELVVTVENLGETPVMFTGSYNIRRDNETIETVGDDEVIFLAGGGRITETYAVDVDEEGVMDVESNIIYGEDTESLENMNVQTLPLDFIEIIDNSEVELKDIYYDRSINRFIISIKNTGEVTAYATAYFEDLIINDRPERVGTDQIITLAPEETGELRIRVDLSPLDIEENPMINVNIRYGAQENILLKRLEEQTELVVKAIDERIIAVGAGIVLLVVFVWFLLKRKKKKSHKKGHKKSHGKTHDTEKGRHGEAHHHHPPPPKRRE